MKINLDSMSYQKQEELAEIATHSTTALFKNTRVVTDT